MKFRRLIFLFVVVIAGCESTENSGPINSTPESELQQFLKMSTLRPLNSLSHTITYSGDSREIHTSEFLIYPAVGGARIHIVKNQLEDTIGIRLDYLENDKIQISHHFGKVGNKLSWLSTSEYVYDLEGKLKELFVESANRPKYLLAKYIYDSQKRLVRIESPAEVGAELMVFTYDEAGRIASQWKTVAGQEDSKLDHLVYNYSDNQLIAKKFWERDKSTEDFKDAFLYIYDPLGRLSKEVEYDKLFGYQQKRWTEYVYH